MVFRWQLFQLLNLALRKADCDSLGQFFIAHVRICLTKVTVRQRFLLRDCLTFATFRANDRRNTIHISRRTLPGKDNARLLPTRRASPLAGDEEGTERLSRHKSGCARSRQESLHKMTTAEAAAQSGLTQWMVGEAAKRGDFVADKPRGNRGGWVIDRQSFNDWLLRRKLRTGNAPCRAMARRQLGL